jgi:hypothetical protein
LGDFFANSSGHSGSGHTCKNVYQSERVVWIFARKCGTAFTKRGHGGGFFFLFMPHVTREKTYICTYIYMFVCMYVSPLRFALVGNSQCHVWHAVWLDWAKIV